MEYGFKEEDDHFKWNYHYPIHFKDDVFLNWADLMEIVKDRYKKASMIITSQLPVNCWHEVIGEKTVADAILDWIAHDAHRIELRGESLRNNRDRKQKMEILSKMNKFA